MSVNENKQTAVLEAVDAAAALAQVFLPQFTAFIVLGRAAAKAAPGLYEDVVKLLSKDEPTPEEKQDLARKLQALANPENV